MTDHAIDTTHAEQALAPQDNDGIGLGAGIAIGAHLALIVALWFGVHWHVGQPTVMSAELWSAVPHEAAPRPQPAPPPPPPEPEVQKTAPPPQPVQPPAAEQQAQRDAQIAIEQAREKKKRDEAEERLLAQRELEKQKAEEARQAADEKAAKAKAAKEKALADQAAKAKAEADAKKAAKAKAKPQPDDGDDQFARELNKRLKAKNGPHSAEDGNGTAAHASAPSTGYAGRIMARIKPNIHYAGLYDQFKAVVDLRVGPDGRIISSKLVQSSGVQTWDDAVLKAIDLTEVLPADIDGRVPPYIELTFSPQDK